MLEEFRGELRGKLLNNTKEVFTNLQESLIRKGSPCRITPFSEFQLFLGSGKYKKGAVGRFNE